MRTLQVKTEGWTGDASYTAWHESDIKFFAKEPYVENVEPQVTVDYTYSGYTTECKKIDELLYYRHFYSRIQQDTADPKVTPIHWSFTYTENALQNINRDMTDELISVDLYHTAISEELRLSLVNQSYVGSSPSLFRYRRIQFYEQIISTALRALRDRSREDFPVELHAIINFRPETDLVTDMRWNQTSVIDWTRCWLKSLSGLDFNETISSIARLQNYVRRIKERQLEIRYEVWGDNVTTLSSMSLKILSAILFIKLFPVSTRWLRSRVFGINGMEITGENRELFWKIGRVTKLIIVIGSFY